MHFRCLQCCFVGGTHWPAGRSNALLHVAHAVDATNGIQFERRLGPALEAATTTHVQHRILRPSRVCVHLSAARRRPPLRLGNPLAADGAWRRIGRSDRRCLGGFGGGIGKLLRVAAPLHLLLRVDIAVESNRATVIRGRPPPRTRQELATSFALPTLSMQDHVARPTYCTLRRIAGLTALGAWLTTAAEKRSGAVGCCSALLRAEQPLLCHAARLRVRRLAGLGKKRRRSRG
mmetsp:Transcript_63819/g.142383  ORF Transcript_63819/g.142383 Transcript_63819/m.142383 type:complete len:233 (+) Transcript_63819:229-927(+)